MIALEILLALSLAATSTLACKGWPGISMKACYSYTDGNHDTVQCIVASEDCPDGTFQVGHTMSGDCSDVTQQIADEGWLRCVSTTAAQRTCRPELVGCSDSEYQSPNDETNKGAFLSVRAIYETLDDCEEFDPYVRCASKEADGGGDYSCQRDYDGCPTTMAQVPSGWLFSGCSECSNFEPDMWIRCSVNSYGRKKRGKLSSPIDQDVYCLQYDPVTQSGCNNIDYDYDADTLFPSYEKCRYQGYGVEYNLCWNLDVDQIECIDRPCYFCPYGDCYDFVGDHIMAMSKREAETDRRQVALQRREKRSGSHHFHRSYGYMPVAHLNESMSTCMAYQPKWSRWFVLDTFYSPITCMPISEVVGTDITPYVTWHRGNNRAAVRIPVNTAYDSEQECLQANVYIRCYDFEQNLYFCSELSTMCGDGEPLDENLRDARYEVTTYAFEDFDECMHVSWFRRCVDIESGEITCRPGQTECIDFVEKLLLISNSSSHKECLEDNAGYYYCYDRTETEERTCTVDYEGCANGTYPLYNELGYVQNFASSIACAQHEPTWRPCVDTVPNNYIICRPEGAHCIDTESELSESFESYEECEEFADDYTFSP